jgi:hypothetical protein
MLLSNFLISLTQRPSEALGSEVETDSCDGKQSKGNQLDNDTCLCNVFPRVELVFRIFVCGLDSASLGL